MTIETKSIIVEDIEKLLSTVETSTKLGVHEIMSPNDIDYESILKSKQVEAVNFMISLLNEYLEDL